MSKLTKSDEQFIIKNYCEKLMTTTEIQKKFQISPNTIYKILEKNSVCLKGNSLDEKLQEKICKIYESGMTIKSICEKLSLSNSSITKYLKKYKVQTRKSEVFKRKYSLDEEIFTSIDSHEKAQFLGLIYADGSLSKFNKNISIRLREDDIDYLDQWRTNLLKTDRPFSFSFRESMINPINKKEYETPFKMVILDISCKKIYEDSLVLGLKPNKSKENLGMPEIEEQFKLPFILGLFEGDGCVTFCQKSRCFQIACQEKMAFDVQKYLKSMGIFATVYKRPSIHILQVARWEDLQKLYSLLYKNASIFLKRKKEKFEQLLDSRIA
jgi:DNA-binding CsgD family transcriptional regulator